VENLPENHYLQEEKGKNLNSEVIIFKSSAAHICSVTTLHDGPDYKLHDITSLWRLRISTSL
jgi:hypothetical protein